MNMSLRDALAALYSAYDATQLAERHAAAAKLISEEQRRRVRHAGDHIPPFDIHDPDQGHISSIDVMKKGPLIANFYRGLWCSYCQRDLLGVEKIMPDIQKVGATVIAITHGLTGDVRAAFNRTVKTSFPIISDEDGLIAEQFGLRWSASDADLIDAEMGIDLVSFRGTRPWILPMQARYLIQQDHVVAFANIAFDYNERTEPPAVLSPLAGLVASQIGQSE
jgi:peroxiredoxin